MGRTQHADDELRRRLAMMLRGQGPSFDHFADRLLASGHDEVQVGRLTGPITEDYVTYLTWRVPGRFCTDECAIAHVGLDRVREMQEAGDGEGLHYVLMISHTMRSDGGFAFLEMLHDGDAIVVANAHDGPPHAYPV